MRHEGAFRHLARQGLLGNLPVKVMDNQFVAGVFGVRPRGLTFLKRTEMINRRNGKLLVKAEWDAVERWLKDNVDGENP